MNATMDFLGAALPWITIGLVAAVTAVSSGDASGKTKKYMIIPAVLMVVVALLKFLDHDNPGAAVWLVLGIAFFLIGILRKPAQDPKQNANSEIRLNREMRRRSKGKK